MPKEPPTLPVSTRTLSRSTPSTAASFKLAQAADIGTIGGADEVRQHVHLGEDSANQRVISRRVRQRCPIGTRDLTALNRLPPQCTDLRHHLRSIELIDRDAMPPIQRLMQQFGATVLLAGDQNPARMELVFRRGVSFSKADLD